MQQMSFLQRLNWLLAKDKGERGKGKVKALFYTFHLLTFPSGLTYSFLISLLSLALILVSCGEENPQELVPDESLKPLLASAPLLTVENHSHGWEKENCQECHSPSTITGHESLGKKCTDCHGRNGVGGTVDTCETCHGQPPDTGTHSSHVKKGNLSCEKCHKDNLHANNVVDLKFSEGGKFSEGSCTITCHKNLEWGESGCNLCHGNPPDTGNHSFHVEERGFSCNQCHADNLHINDVLEVKFSKGGNYSDGTCTPKCHQSVEWGASGCSLCHENPPDTGYHELHVEEQEFDCDSCHRDREHDRNTESGEIDIGGVEYELLDGSCTPVCHEEEKWGCESCHGYPSDTGQHVGHESFDCNICHNEHDHSYKAAMNPSDFSNAEVKFEIMGSFEEVSKTCLTIGCHEDRNW